MLCCLQSRIIGMIPWFVYVCIYVCVYVCMHVYACACMLMYVRARVYVWVRGLDTWNFLDLSWFAVRNTIISTSQSKHQICIEETPMCMQASQCVCKHHHVYSSITMCMQALQCVCFCVYDCKCHIIIPYHTTPCSIGLSSSYMASCAWSSYHITPHLAA